MYRRMSRKKKLKSANNKLKNNSEETNKQTDELITKCEHFAINVILC